MGIHVAQPPVAKGPGQGAHNLKAVFLPAADASGVAAHHQVELHRSVAQPPGRPQRVFAEAAADPPPPAVLRHHVAGIGHMGAEAEGIGLQVIAAHHGSADQ